MHSFLIRLLFHLFISSRNRLFYEQSSRRDGLNWPVVAGCTEYTLSQEQLAQKEEKYKKRRAFKINHDLGWLNWRGGLRTILTTPLCEDRLKAEVNEFGVWGFSNFAIHILTVRSVFVIFFSDW